MTKINKQEVEKKFLGKFFKLADAIDLDELFFEHFHPSLFSTSDEIIIFNKSNFKDQKFFCVEVIEWTDEIHKKFTSIHNLEVNLRKHDLFVLKFVSLNLGGKILYYDVFIEKSEHLKNFNIFKEIYNEK